MQPVPVVDEVLQTGRLILSNPLASSIRGRCCFPIAKLTSRQTSKVSLTVHFLLTSSSFPQEFQLEDSMSSAAMTDLQWRQMRKRHGRRKQGKEDEKEMEDEKRKKRKAKKKRVGETNDKESVEKD